MFTELSAAVSSLKLATEMIRATNALSNRVEMLDVLTTVRNELNEAALTHMDTLEKMKALTQENEALTAALKQVRDFESKAQNYELCAVAPGVFAYVYKPAAETKQPRHWTCVHCFQSQKLSLLQNDQYGAYKCSSCGSKIKPTDGGILISIDAAYETP